MDIPNIGDLAQNAKDGVVAKIQDAVLNNDAVEKVIDGVSSSIDKVEGLADKVGLGDALDNVINAAEKKTGMDIDKDGDIGA